MCAPMRAWSLIALSLVTSACTSHLLGFDPDEGDDSVGSVTTDKPYPYGEDWETGSFETTDTTDTTDDWDTGNFVPTDDTDVSDTTDTGPIPDLPPDFPSPWCGPLGIDWELDLGAGRISGLDYVPGAGMVALQLNRLGPTSAALHRIGPGGDLQATIDPDFAFDDAEQQLVSLHIAVHEQAALHQRVHLLWFRLGRAQRSVRMQAGQVFPIVFAVPVSLVHRYLGLAVGRHREPV